MVIGAVWTADGKIRSDPASAPAIAMGSVRIEAGNAMLADAAPAIVIGAVWRDGGKLTGALTGAPVIVIGDVVIEFGSSEAGAAEPAVFIETNENPKSARAGDGRIRRDALFNRRFP